MITLGQFAAQLRAAATATPALITATLDVEMKELANVARGWPGHTHSGWPPLASATVERRERAGYAPDAPLFASGELHDGIVGGAEPEGAVVVGYVGNTVPHAVYHEIGWSGGPPRPIYSRVLTENLPKLEAAMSALARRLLIGELRL